MIGGGRRSKYASSYDGKSPEEIRKVKKARKAALEKARRMNRSQQKADEEKEEDRARKKTPQNREKGRDRMKTPQNRESDKNRKKAPQNRARHKTRMRNTRARSKQEREDMSCSFEKSKVWEIPGKDYSHTNFENSPEMAVQLWLDNNFLLRFPVVAVIRIVESIPNDGFVVAHNMEHEHTVLTNSFSPNQRILWNDAPKCDTWNVKLLKFLPEQVLIKYYGGSKLQWRKLGLKLSELHRHISPDTHTSYATFAHHACTDVDMTWEIFQYYMLHAPSELLAWTNQSGGKSVKSMFHIRKKEVIDAKSRV